MNGNDFTNEQIDTFANAMTQFIERVAESRNKLEAEPFVFDLQEWEENKNNKSYLKQLFTAGGQMFSAVTVITRIGTYINKSRVCNAELKLKHTERIDLLTISNTLTNDIVWSVSDKEIIDFEILKCTRANIYIQFTVCAVKCELRIDI